MGERKDGDDIRIKVHDFWSGSSMNFNQKVPSYKNKIKQISCYIGADNGLFWWFLNDCFLDLIHPRKWSNRKFYDWI